MSPPGRRRSGVSLLSLILLGVLFFSRTASAASAVLGIDLGTEYIKAALVKPGIPLEIVLSKDSKRKEPSIVAFKTPKGNAIGKSSYPERSYGSAALAIAPRFPGDAYPNLKQLLGLPVDGSSVVDEYKSRYPALDVVKTDPRGTAAFKSKSFEKGETPFAVEELLGMELKNVISNAQLLAGKMHKVQSVVFTIPPFYTIEEKSALELAADLAGLKVLGVVTDGMAVGINYATSRKFEAINDGAKPEHHMVFDVGAGYTTATVLKMQGRTVKDVGKFNKTIQEVIVQGTGWDRTLGGDALNSIIVKDIAEKFIQSSEGKKTGKSVSDFLAHGRTTARVWKEAERLRQVLSANQQTAASWEELYEDVDFKYKLTRAEFETKTKEFAKRLAIPFNNALKAANLSTSDLDSVILHGGAIRTPFIQKQLGAMVEDEGKVRSNVNSDEAAVFGAAFKAASISPSFRVKEIRSYDAAIYPTWMQYSKDGKTKQQKVFTPTSFVGSTKVITLPKMEDFEIYLFQKRPTDAGSPFEAISGGNSGTKYMSKNLATSYKKLETEFECKPENISTTVTLRLDPIWGLPEVVGGSVSCDREVVDKTVMDNVKDFLGFGKKDDGSQKVLKDDKKGSSSSSASSSSSSSSSADPKASDAAKDAKEPPKMKLKTETVKFEFSEDHDESTVIPFVEHKFIAERIRSFDASDKDRISREEDLNNLESFAYRARDLIEDSTFASFASKPMLSEIEALVRSTTNWLSDDGAKATSEVLKEKLAALKKLVDPIRRRKDEASKRPEMLDLLRKSLDSTKGFVSIIQESIEQASKSAASVADEASSTVSSAASVVSSAVMPDSSADPLADLEEEESSASSSAAPTPSAEPFMAPYSEDDLKEMSAAYEEVNTWLEQKIKEQEKLQPWEEPIFEAGELQRKSKALNDVLYKLVSKKMKSAGGGSKPKADGKKGSKKSAKKDEAKKAKTEDKAKPTIKDEL